VTTIRLFRTLIAIRANGAAIRMAGDAHHARWLQALFGKQQARVDCASVDGPVPTARFGNDNRLRRDMARPRRSVLDRLKEGP
jgi:hypothetical protein